MEMALHNDQLQSYHQIYTLDAMKLISEQLMKMKQLSETSSDFRNLVDALPKFFAKSAPSDSTAPLFTKNIEDKRACFWQLYGRDGPCNCSFTNFLKL